MSNVFDKIGDIRNNINRNTFDWSHTKNLTTAFGRITPIMCEYCPPKTSLRIDPEFGLRFMPMMFPVQTTMKAYMSFYRVPLRTLWKDYKDWISSANENNSAEDYIPPFVGVDPSSLLENGSFHVSGLADYLDIPVTSFQGDITASKIGGSDNKVSMPMTLDQFGIGGIDVDGSISLQAAGPASNYEYTNLNDLKSGTWSYAVYGLYSNIKFSGSAPKSQQVVPIRVTITGSAPYISGMATALEKSQSMPQFAQYGAMFVASLSGGSVSGNSYVGATKIQNYVRLWTATHASDLIEVNLNAATPYLSFEVQVPVDSNTKAIVLCVAATSEFMNNPKSNMTLYGEKNWELIFDSEQVALSAANCPYYLSTDNSTTGKNKIKLSAYPFRAYEAIYNAYIRNIKNNPFKVSGKAKYNTWIPTDEGGQDNTIYGLHYANWFSDMFTTALPSPQQGQAPLVGLTTYEKTVTLENGHTETKLSTAIVDEDGNKYAVDFESNGEELKGVKYTELGKDTPVAPVSNLYDVVTSGISINDFRNVNAYQRYLELNQFRGFSYKEIIEGRFDVNIKYDDLNMPEYLGGCTRTVTMNTVTQTVDNDSSGSYAGALGSQAGNATLYGKVDASIDCFCDEESFVIGLLTVVPMPIYTQTLPKHFLYRDRLDVFNPEFDHIGYQPISMKELCPVLQYNADNTKMDQTFGYQRPWYEYCQKVDRASGLFRTQLRNFLINRVFYEPPVLGADFTTVNPEDVNDVFSVTETTDKILGQVALHITAKLPISRVVVPKLE